MLWAKSAKKNPRAIAEQILNNIDDADGILARREIAGPGFLNFAFASKFYFAQLREIAAGKQDKIDIGHGRKVQVEFASVNPTWPLHVGHGGGGDRRCRSGALCMAAAGYEVEREYYVNDAGNQMENLGQSLYARYLEALGQPAEFPEAGYPGDYVKDIAAEVAARDGDKYLRRDKDEAVKFFRQYGGDALLNTIRRQLGDFGIRFDSDFSETAMRARSEVAQSMTALRERGSLYNQDGAEWYRSTQFGDDKDRTLIKSDGELTYFAADIAYHRNKFERGFDKLINVWGADHHGYVPRLKAAMQGLGYDANALQVVLVQMVQLVVAASRCAWASARVNSSLSKTCSKKWGATRRGFSISCASRTAISTSIWSWRKSSRATIRCSTSSTWPRSGERRDLGRESRAFYSVDHEAIRNLPHVVTCGQRLNDGRSLERPILSGVEFQHWHRLLKEETCAS